METAHELFNRAKDAAEHISGKAKGGVDVGIILGSGLSPAGDFVDERVSIPYGQIPNFPRPSVPGHEGRVVVGGYADKKVAVFRGRFHLYEGYTVQSVVFPVRVMKELGAGVLVITNAAGALREGFDVGDLVLIRDHINLTGENPLIALADKRLGERFPDMTGAYDAELADLALDVAAGAGIELKEGVYAGVLGPSFETPAEREAINRLGADLVGMSTVNEVIAARQGGLKVLGVSLVTNVAVGDNPADHEEVLQVAAVSAEKLGTVLAGIIRRLF